MKSPRGGSEGERPEGEECRVAARLAASSQEAPVKVPSSLSSPLALTPLLFVLRLLLPMVPWPPLLPSVPLVLLPCASLRQLSSSLALRALPLVSSQPQGVPCLVLPRARPPPCHVAWRCSTLRLHPPWLCSFVSGGTWSARKQAEIRSRRLWGGRLWEALGGRGSSVFRTGGGPE